MDPLPKTCTFDSIFAMFSSFKRFTLPLVLLVVLGFGTWKLTESPAIWGDEGMIVELAVNLVRHGEMKMQLAPNLFASPAFTSTGFPVVFPVAASFAMFGVGILQARVVMVIFMLLCVGIFFLLAQKLHGTKIALLSSLLVATFPPFYGDGKNVLGEVPGMFFLFSFLFALHRLLTTTKYQRAMALVTGLSLGLCVVTKPIFLLLIPAVGLGAILFWKQRPRDLGVWLLLVLGGITPLFVWFSTQFLATDSASDILGFYSNPYQLENIQSVILTNILRFARESTPLYLAIFFGIWAVSFLRRAWTKQVDAIETIAFLFTGAILAAYLRTPGWYRYFFPAQLVTFLFAPKALRDITDWVGARIPRRQLIPTALLAVLILFQTYQVGFDSWVANTYKSHMTRDVVAYASTLDPNAHIFLHSVPELIPFLPSATYSQYIELEPEPIGTEQLEALTAGIPTILIMQDKRWDATKETYPTYQEIHRVGRYVISEKQNR